MTILISNITPKDAETIESILQQFWGGDPIIVHDQVFHLIDLPGLKACMDGKLVGILHYQIREGECEILSLASLKEGVGIGSALLAAIEQIANDSRCTTLCLTTTNDNLHALGFYQRRGFRLTGLHPGKINQIRKIKPTIPEIGENNIPIRDELRLEKDLGE